MIRRNTQARSPSSMAAKLMVVGVVLLVFFHGFGKESFALENLPKFAEKKAVTSPETDIPKEAKPYLPERGLLLISIGLCPEKRIFVDLDKETLSYGRVDFVTKYPSASAYDKLPVEGQLRLSVYELANIITLANKIWSSKEQFPRPSNLAIECKVDLYLSDKGIYRVVKDFRDGPPDELYRYVWETVRKATEFDAKKWAMEIAKLYNVSHEREAEIAQTYEQWFEAHREGLKGLPKLLLRILNDLAEKKQDEVARAKPADREKILQMDTIWTELKPIDHRSYELALRVLEGKRLDGQEKSEAQELKAKLETIRKKIDELKIDKDRSLATIISETLLDLIYASNDGKGPMSLRLGHIPRGLQQKSATAEKKELTEKEAVRIAIETARNDKYIGESFKSPYVEGGTRVGPNWVIQLQSENPQPKEGAFVLGGYYFYVTIDAQTGKVVAIDSGGGS